MSGVNAMITFRASFFPIFLVPVLVNWRLSGSLIVDAGNRGRMWTNTMSHEDERSHETYGTLVELWMTVVQRSFCSWALNIITCSNEGRRMSSALSLSLSLPLFFRLSFPIVVLCARVWRVYRSFMCTRNTSMNHAMPP